MIRVIDLETSGEDPDVDIVEVGWSDIDGNSYSGWDHVGPPHENYLVNPGRAITPQSSAIHHIINEDVKNSPRPAEILAKAFDCTSETIFVAHYADHELSLLGGRNHKWIDTWKVAIVLAPNAPSWSLQGLRYWLGLEVNRNWALPAHRAGPDAYVTAALLLRMLAKMTPDQMVAISSKPAFLPRLGFGKHAKDPIGDVPIGYLDWILKQRKPDGGFQFDKNVIHTAMTEIENRQKNPRR